MLLKDNRNSIAVGMRCSGFLERTSTVEIVGNTRKHGHLVEFRNSWPTVRRGRLWLRYRMYIVIIVHTVILCASVFRHQPRSRENE
jgi:hypothetical protein